MKFTLKTNGLGKRFNREWIFRKFTYTFESSNLYAITGPNGSGKSTLMQVLWGQSLQTAGTLDYRLDDQEIPIGEVYNHISIATPYMDLIDEFTLDEQIALHFKMKKIRSGYRVEDLPAIMYLQSARKKQIGNFSSGMRQRLKLALAFYTEAAVLFLDEPGTNLDQQAFDWYLTQLNQIKTNTLTILASNNPAEYPNPTAILNVSDFK